MEFVHKSVLLDEVIEGLDIKENGTYVDGTLGGAGHAGHVCERLGTDGRFIGIDQDEDAIKVSTERLKKYGDKVTIVRSNYSDMPDVVHELGISGVDGITLDLGVSSFQLDTAERGFSYRMDAPLDMRMDQTRDFSAWDVVNTYSESELARIIREYGEENWAKRIAQFIVERRKVKPLETTGELVEAIKAAIPKKARQEGSHPAKRTFQAIRIEVNGELDVLEKTIEQAKDGLRLGGRLGIISFHSLEDRIVKEKFKYLAASCICPPEMPICCCNKVSEVKILTKKRRLRTRSTNNFSCFHYTFRVLSQIG